MHISKLHNMWISYYCNFTIWWNW